MTTIRIKPLHIAAHTEEEALEALAVVEKLSNLLGPVYRVLEASTGPEELAEPLYMLLDLLAKLYSAGYEMGKNEDSGFIEYYKGLLEKVEASYARHNLN